MRHGSRYIAALILATLSTALAGSQHSMNDVRATVTGLRSSDGQVLACLTRNSATFPNCDRDPDARKLVVPAHESVELEFGAVPADNYAIAIVHDENGNGKLDKRLIIPREGFGFSRDAAVRFGPPSFQSASFNVGNGERPQVIRMRYLF